MQELLLMTAIFAVFVVLNVRPTKDAVATMDVYSHGTLQVAELPGRCYGWPLYFYVIQDDSTISDFVGKRLAANAAIAITASFLAVVAWRWLRE
jgi:hypothetical protein